MDESTAESASREAIDIVNRAYVAQLAKLGFEPEPPEPIDHPAE